MPSLTRQQISTLQTIIGKNIPIRKKAKWLVHFAHATGIGSVRSNAVELSITDIETLKGYFVTQRIPLTFEDGDLSTRTTTAKVLSNEKIAQSSVTHCRYLVSTLSDTLHIEKSVLPAGRATDVTLEELLSLPLSRLIIVENLETFLNLRLYSNIQQFADERTLFVFRGMKGCYSTKSLLSLMEQFEGEKIGYFDFDPQGLIQCGHKGFDGVIVPEAGALTRLMMHGHMLSDNDKFTKQHHCTLSFNQERLKTHYEMMCKYKLALSQEYLSAIEAPLDMIALN
ncbi:MAG: hypothetical protein ABNH03_14570 [Alteromonas sp.]|jgi:hypothetical protein|uniref:DUF7281 domain-containing protein n=1 Tax=Alteromonas sp. TaxID=232 RepID=UPI000B72EA33|nr:hypothetical protein [Pseudoalteromonas sp.]OUX83947.1 MAG: hypothetical protein CBB95_17335 [Alteromonas sp. TMED35]|tara:strand:- start:10640 stop:11488 length:849 start_codon:yes stop_codon:yes gene_type:complete